jgi:transcription-repair coupling factor (superfamily II helicase)
VDALIQLIQKYQNAPKVKQIAQWLEQSETPARLQLLGMTGAQESFVLAGTYLNNPQPYLVICTDKEEAAYFQNDLQSLHSTKTIHFLPDSFKYPTKFEDIKPDNVLQRTEVINRLAQSTAHGEVIVTYPEALFEKVVAPQYLSEKRIDINLGEKLDVDFMLEILVEYGFQHVDFVY